jgi:ribonucleotide monophosphatase NagD (HAD superfamily)
LFQVLKDCGFNIEKHEIYSSLSAARQLIDKNNLRPLLFLENEALEDFNGTCYDKTKHIIDYLKFKFNTDLDSSDPNAVVIGLAPTKFDYTNLNNAFKILLDGAQLIAIHKGRYYKRSDGLALGPGRV